MFNLTGIETLGIIVFVLIAAVFIIVSRTGKDLIAGSTEGMPIVEDEKPKATPVAKKKVAKKKVAKKKVAKKKVAKKKVAKKSPKKDK